MKSWKIFCLVFVSVTLASLPARKIDACGIGGRAQKNYTFLETAANQLESDYAPFLLGQSFDTLAAYYVNRQNPQITDNVAEWRGRFCNNPDSADIAQILYHTSVEDLASLRLAATVKRRDVYYDLQKNTFAQALKENRCLETIDYLLFAKRCEPYALKGNQWTGASMDSSMMYVLMKQGRDLFRETSAPFLKLRFLYQVIRLAHYAKDYPAVLRAYDEMTPKMDRVNSIVNYWVLGHRAGALYKTGKRVEAAYDYALVFCYCPSKREQAFRSFDLRTDQEWRECLQMCTNDRERSALFALRASAPNANALDDMVQMYRLYPKSDQLELLLIKETQKLEKILLGKDFRRPKYSAAAREKAGKYLLDLRLFVHQCAEEKQVRRPALWKAVEGYQTLLAGDWYNARKIFFETNATARDTVLKRQISVFDLAAQIASLQSAGLESDSLVQHIRNSDIYLSSNYFDDYLHEKMASLYKKEKNWGAAFLCDYSMIDLTLNPKMEVVDQLIDLCRNPGKTVFEKELILKSPGQTIENDLLDIKGTILLNQYHPEAAAAVFGQIPEAVFKTRSPRFSPFVERVNDCIRCRTIDTATYDKLEFAQRLIDLENQAKINYMNPAPFYYQLGLAYYNITYFGPAYRALDFFRSGSTWQRMNQGADIFTKPGRPLGNKENIDCAQALRYFELARQGALDPELAARAAFMAAKCEQNIFFTSKDNHYRTGSKLIPDVPPAYHQYFGLLKTYYANTDFYKQVVRECKYFRYYSLK